MSLFPTERALTSAFIRSLTNIPLLARRAYPVVLRCEVKGFVGVPDILLAFGRPSRSTCFRTICFELKLSNWKRALMQAYRYAAFADYSFVVLDVSAETKAIAHLDLFVRSNIGLITVSEDDKLSLHYFPKARRPYCANSSAKLESWLRSRSRWESQSCGIDAYVS